MKYILLLTFIGLITVIFLSGFAFRMLRSRIIKKEREERWS